VQLNDAELSIGQEITAADLRVTKQSAHRLTIRVSAFELQLENSDRFVNLVSVRRLPGHSLHSHGLLGQTWTSPRSAAHEVPCIEGWIDDYVEANNELLGRALLYQRITADS
jgi:hypothetical protein